MTNDPRQIVLTDVTCGITTTGNMEALHMALSSILMQEYLPSKILLRFEGKFPSFATFYVEQLSELARLKGVLFSLTVDTSHGIRYARDFLIDNCTTKLLWMGDDDVVYSPHCLRMLITAYNTVSAEFGDGVVSYVNGNKPDVNNRRGYEDFTTTPIPSSSVKNNDGYNAVFSGANCIVECETADTGNLLINVSNIRRHSIRFEHYEYAFNSSGDDTLFALLCKKAGLMGFFSTRADSFHLEKPNVRFNEFAARKNMLLAQCKLEDIDPSFLRSMLPWLKMEQAKRRKDLPCSS